MHILHRGNGDLIGKIYHNESSNTWHNHHGTWTRQFMKTQHEVHFSLFNWLYGGFSPIKMLPLCINFNLDKKKWKIDASIILETRTHQHGLLNSCKISTYTGKHCKLELNCDIKGFRVVMPHGGSTFRG